ncbi:hypothetical protein HID58_066399 [Brassica napus]|uniref:PPM-type phosphatase domain-containing protein n=1 Tax=Brassica napus TaxID=3708 RepID=A0ABQ7ZFI5_BRANA|nr:hypothetical protein HID58_066399 [Brassica napus]
MDILRSATKPSLRCDLAASVYGVDLMEEEYQVLIQENCRYGSGHLAQIPPPLVVEFFLGLDIRIDRTVEPMLCLHGCIPLTEHELQPQDQFLIFASDGLWEQLSNYQEDVDIVQNHPRNVCVRPIFPQETNGWEGAAAVIRMMATNYIGAFSLRKLLLQLLRNSHVPSSRVVYVTSFTHRSGFCYGSVLFGDAYTVASFCEIVCLVLFSYELHRQLHLLTDDSHHVSIA